MRVLLVEDDVQFGQALRFALDGLDGLVLIQVTSLTGALEELGRDRPDAVILDLLLPDSAGINTVSRLRQEAPEVPVLVLTANDDPTTRAAALELGVADYLLKAQDEGRLESLLRAVVTEGTGTLT